MTIRTRYIPATDTKPARVHAQGYGISAEIPYNEALDSLGNHLTAVRQLPGFRIIGATRAANGFAVTVAKIEAPVTV